MPQKFHYYFRPIAAAYANLIEERRVDCLRKSQLGSSTDYKSCVEIQCLYVHSYKCLSTWELLLFTLFNSTHKHELHNKENMRTFLISRSGKHDSEYMFRKNIQKYNFKLFPKYQNYNSLNSSWLHM